MPARPCDQTRKTFYFDTSTLSYAYQGAQVGAPANLAPFAPLVGWLERVAREANLIFSWVHLAEIAEWGDPAAATGLMRWLDSLELVWARFFDEVRDDEDEHWVRVAVGEAAPPAVRPFAPSMLTVFEDAPGPILSAGLGQTAVDAFCEERDGGNRVGTKLRRDADQIGRAFHANRAAFGWPKIDPADLVKLEDRADYEWRCELRGRAEAAHQRLMTRSEADYVALLPDLNKVVDPFVDLCSNLGKAAPISKILNRAAKGWAATAANRQPGSNSFRALGSSASDLFHALTGAAYCDVFTCDRLTSTWLDRVRPNLGLPAEIVLGGDPVAFVRALTATWVP